MQIPCVAFVLDLAVACAGYGSYGPPAGWLHGARVILLRAGQDPMHAESWIRLENGSRVDQAQAAGSSIAAGQQTACDSRELSLTNAALQYMYCSLAV